MPYRLKVPLAIERCEDLELEFESPPTREDIEKRLEAMEIEGSSYEVLYEWLEPLPNKRKSMRASQHYRSYSPIFDLEPDKQEFRLAL